MRKLLIGTLTVVGLLLAQTTVDLRSQPGGALPSTVVATRVGEKLVRQPDGLWPLASLLTTGTQKRNSIK